MEMKFLYAGFLLLAGFLFFYICTRQLIYNFSVTLPLIKKFSPLGEEVFSAKFAKRFNGVSTFVWVLINAGIVFVIARYCPLYLQLSFIAGFVFGLLGSFKQLGINKKNFLSFCYMYARFSLNTELYSAMGEGKIKIINSFFKSQGLESFDLDLK